MSRPTPTIKVWPTPGNEKLSHPVSGALRASGGSPWAHDAFTIRRLQSGEITTVAPTSDLGRQREAIINEKLARESDKS